MSDALDLVKAILADEQGDDATALAILEKALVLEVDILRYCATALGINAATVMQRAARWAGYGFFDRVPRGLIGRVEPTRLEALADVRLFRVHLLDREVAFAAPDFLGLIRLKHRLAITPRLTHQLCLVPEAALRDHLTTVAGAALIDGARQNLARHWPYASAQLELTALARYGFAFALAMLLIMVLIAPFFCPAGPAAIRRGHPHRSSRPAVGGCAGAATARARAASSARRRAAGLFHPDPAAQRGSHGAPALRGHAGARLPGIAA